MKQSPALRSWGGWHDCVQGGSFLMQKVSATVFLRSSASNEMRKVVHF
jgi:hypothetical protein